VRRQGQGDQGTMTKEDFIKKISQEVADMLKNV
jgi:threonyl-tRNA synthetase